MRCHVKRVHDYDDNNNSNDNQSSADCRQGFRVILLSLYDKKGCWNSLILPRGSGGNFCKLLEEQSWFPQWWILHPLGLWKGATSWPTDIWTADDCNCSCKKGPFVYVRLSSFFLTHIKYGNFINCIPDQSLHDFLKIKLKKGSDPIIQVHLCNLLEACRGWFPLRCVLDINQLQSIWVSEGFYLFWAVYIKRHMRPVCNSDGLADFPAEQRHQRQRQGCTLIDNISLVRQQTAAPNVTQQLQHPKSPGLSLTECLPP